MERSFFLWEHYPGADLKVYFPTLYKMWIWCILIQAKPLWRFCSSSNPEKKKNVCMCLRQVSVREFLIWIDQSNKPPPFLLSCHSYFLPQITKPKSIDLLPLIKKTVHNAQRRRWKKWTHNSCFEWKPLAFKWSPSQYLKGVPITKGVQGVSLNVACFQRHVFIVSYLAGVMWPDSFDCWRGDSRSRPVW